MPITIHPTWKATGTSERNAYIPPLLPFLMNRELTNAFEKAAQALKETETLLAWRELELSERRDGCDFWLADGSSCGRDLQAQLGRFFALFFSIHEYVGTRPRAAQRRPMQELQRLWKQFRTLELRVVKPGIIPPGT